MNKEFNKFTQKYYLHNTAWH